MSDQHREFLTVGIGASAGGLDALRLFFRDLPASPGMAFVLVTHLDRTQKSQMPEILGRFTNLAVVLVDEQTRVEADNLYVTPPGTVLTMAGGVLFPQPAENPQQLAKSIDVFFASLALDQGENAAGVVLSGLDGDGTLGIKAIKERNGLTIAQVGDESTLKFDSMPQSAIATGLVDLPLPADEMALRLIEFARGMGILSADGVDTTVVSPQDVLASKTAICAIVSKQVGHDFLGYKDQTFARRVMRRCVFQSIHDISGYLTLLQTDAAEVTALFRDLLINVTDFFRDAEAFESLEREVIPSILSGRTKGDTVRVWVPGCATGEEVFSLAILFKEAIDRLAEPPRLLIFATDIDDRSLEVARAGRFPLPLMKGVSDERRRRFFVEDGEAFVVDRSIREACIFSAHSVFRDPPFSRLDLISCRNLLIYLGGDTQQQVLPIFHYALRNNGFLFLGLSENIGRHAELFDPVDRKNRIFRALGVAQSMPRLPFVIDREPGYPAIAPRSAVISRLRREAEAQVLDKHAPQFVVVNAAGNVVYFSADTGLFLQPALGAPSRALSDLVRKGARQEARSALSAAIEFNQPVKKHGLVVDAGGGRNRTFSLTVEPLDKRKETESLFLVVFEETPNDPRRPMLENQVDGGTLVIDPDNEIRDLRERLQTTIEEYETSMEELRSSNEELVSLNEEQQSTNEELEASREEMQSLNEELQTVNAELSGNISELDAANEDLRHFFESTDTATVFLDADLLIQNYTPPASEVFRIKSGDKGRPLADLSMRIHYPDFNDDLKQCLLDGLQKQREVAGSDTQARFLLRIRPFAKLRSSARGLVITAVDVTELAQLRAALARDDAPSES